MNVFKRIFGKDGKFFDLLEASATEARNGAALLVKLLADTDGQNLDDQLAELALSRRKHKRISREITEQLCRTFVTPLEREDIEALSSVLYRITKNIEKIGERLLICPRKISSENFAKQISMIEHATNEVASMVFELRKKSHVEKISDAYERLQTVEGEADKLMVHVLRDLYQGSIEAKDVIILKDIYELLEKVIDRCRDAGNVVFQVILKYS